MQNNSENIVIENKVLRSINNCEGVVTIPPEVIKIGKGAFKGSEVSSVVFEGNNLKSIEDEAFRNCTRLKNIMIPEGVIQIGDNAFEGCSNLDYIGIPESVVVVGDNILDNCKSDLFVIGKEGSEAFNIANQYKITLRSDSANAIAAFEQASAEKTKKETREFDIFGETILCSNTLSKYHDTLEYYSSRKEPIFKEFVSKLPLTLNESFGDLLATLKEEQNNLISRLSSQGVFITEKALSIYLVEPYKAIAEAAKAIREVYDAVNKDLVDGINNNREALISEAESKVTGLSYGIIGDGLDMLAYSIDDFNERQRQRQKAYAEAEKKAAEFRKQHTSQGNQIYSEFISKALPFLNQGTDLFIDALCVAENDFLVKAGLIDAAFIDTIDPAKSSQIMNSIADKKDDNTFAVALALKKYPCNIAALVYAKEHGYKCQGLTDLVSFLGFDSKLESGITESRRMRILEKTEALKTMTDGNAGVALIERDVALLNEDEIKKLLRVLATSISSSIEQLLKPEKLDSIIDVKAYISVELDKIVSLDTWNYFLEHDVLPIKSSVIKQTKNHSELEKWLCDELRLIIDTKEKEYLKAKELGSRARTISSLDKAAELFSKLGNYKDSEKEYKALNQRKRQKHINRVKILGAIGIIIFISALVAMAFGNLAAGVLAMIAIVVIGIAGVKELLAAGV